MTFCPEREAIRLRKPEPFFTLRKEPRNVRFIGYELLGEPIFKFLG
jgi:hypothetical protein